MQIVKDLRAVLTVQNDEHTNRAGLVRAQSHTQDAGSGGLGALTAARQRHVWGVGVDVDQSFLGPHILTSAISRYDRGVFDAIHRFARGKLGASAVYDLHNGGVELGRINARVPAELERRLARVRRQIVNGTIVVPRPRG